MEKQKQTDKWAKLRERARVSREQRKVDEVAAVLDVPEPPPGRRAAKAPAPEEVPPPPLAGRGSAMWSTTLTEGDVKMIRAMHARGWSIQQLSERYKVTWMTMSKIVKRQSWRHVE